MQPRRVLNTAIVCLLPQDQHLVTRTGEFSKLSDLLAATFSFRNDCKSLSSTRAEAGLPLSARIFTVCECPYRAA